MTTSVRLSKWGNNVGMRLSKYLMDAMELKVRYALGISLEKDRVVLYPAHKYSLEDLVSKITEENRHRETNWGNDKEGKEIGNRK
ncbi:hypothetical protein [Acetomicrobium sp.]|uniref:AbrB/MazE/SpoVT family DNA-binding domain-containing protein n=1 Tax=Acetomicrobium sp. TaxID=1872099 RepID=UPI0028715D62|nr:hypothetical protein [Acetomicrobium sp.]MDR9769513.1 hypothetical protein [Acetomicrobium sp.]